MLSSNKLRARKILIALRDKYSKAKIVLKYSNNFELLVSVMLSAQTTDLQVNKVTGVLFPKYKKTRNELADIYNQFNKLNIPKKDLIEIVNFANVNLKELEKDIRSIGLYKTKAKNIKASAVILLKHYNGIIPKSMEEIITLPGVGRKTANVVLGNAYGIVEGIAVDTHVKRLSKKYGFTKETNPDRIEKDLMVLFDRKDWFKLTYLLIEHGRNIRKFKKDFIVDQGLA